jgi:hypothetical protein
VQTHDDQKPKQAQGLLYGLMVRAGWLRALTLIPPLAIFAFLAWVWYTYALVLLPYRARFLNTPIQTVVYALLFQVLWLLDAISLAVTLYRGPGFVKRSQTTLLERAIRNELPEGHADEQILLRNPYTVKGKNAFVLDGDNSSDSEDSTEERGSLGEEFGEEFPMGADDGVVEGRETSLMAKSNGQTRFCRKV